MKKAKWILVLAIALGIGSAFTTTASHSKKTNTYYAVYTSETEFHWVLLEGDPNDCFEDETKACLVVAESLPEANTKPSGYIPGEYDIP
jgi:hypothetical protein